MSIQRCCKMFKEPKRTSSFKVLVMQHFDNWLGSGGLKQLLGHEERCSLASLLTSFMQNKDL